jgi:DNA-binding transcriptional MocR family regulator
VFFIGSLSKIMAGGLRIAFVRPPRAAYERMAARLAAIGWMTSPLNAELAKLLLDSGQADQVISRRKLSIGRRVALTRKLLGKQNVATAPGCYHAWLSLPEPWTGDACAIELAQRGVLVRSANTFYVGRRHIPRAIRLSLSAASDLEQLRVALERVRTVLASNAPQTAL